jgi:hypothetical protein
MLAEDPLSLPSQQDRCCVAHDFNAERAWQQVPCALRRSTRLRAISVITSQFGKGMKPVLW